MKMLEHIIVESPHRVGNIIYAGPDEEANKKYAEKSLENDREELTSTLEFWNEMGSRQQEGSYLEYIRSEQRLVEERLSNLKVEYLSWDEYRSEFPFVLSPDLER